MCLCFLAIMMQLLIAYLMTLQRVQFHLKNMETPKLLRWGRVCLCNVRKVFKNRAVLQNNQITVHVEQLVLFDHCTKRWEGCGSMRGGVWEYEGREEIDQTGSFKMQWNPPNLLYMYMYSCPIANNCLLKVLGANYVYSISNQKKVSSNRIVWKRFSSYFLY